MAVLGDLEDSILINSYIRQLSLCNMDINMNINIKIKIELTIAAIFILEIAKAFNLF